MTENTPEQNDAFSPENFNIVVLIQLARLYDLLWLNLAESNPNAARMILEKHTHGEHLVPPPAWAD